MRIFVMFLSCLSIICCHSEMGDELSSSDSHPKMEQTYLEAEYPITLPRTAEPAPPPSEKANMLIKNGQMKFEVAHLEKSKEKIDSIIGAANGYYEKDKYSSYANRKSYSLAVRIPNDNFDLVVTALGNLSQLTSKNVSVNDVAEQYVDVKLRLENSLAYLKQYQEILSKAKSIQEILKVKEIIRRIEEDIESKKGRLRYFDDKVKYSTLEIELSELLSTDFATSPSIPIRIGNAFTGGAQGLLDILIGVLYIWPILLIGIVFIFVRRPSIKRSKRRWKAS